MQSVTHTQNVSTVNVHLCKVQHYGMHTYVLALASMKSKPAEINSKQNWEIIYKHSRVPHAKIMLEY